MIYDLDFVRDIPEAINLFGSERVFHRNPFLLPFCIDELVGETEHSSTSPWKDVNLHRICKASFLILLDEFHYKRDNTATGIIPMAAAKFLPPSINTQELSAIHAMSYPPAAAVVALCCAHLIFDTVEADVMSKLIFLTKSIMLKIFRHPLDDIVERAKSFNPLRNVDKSLIKIIAPFVMHDTLKQELQNDMSEQIIHLLIWLRVLVSRSIDQNDISKSSKAANKVILELESDYQKHSSQYKGYMFSTKRDVYCA